MHVQEEMLTLHEARKKIKTEMKGRDEMTESARIYESDRICGQGQCLFLCFEH